MSIVTEYEPMVTKAPEAERAVACSIGVAFRPAFIPDYTHKFHSRIQHMWPSVCFPNSA